MLPVVVTGVQLKNEGTLRAVIEKMVRISKDEAEIINGSLGLKRDDYRFPVEHLEEIVAKNFDDATIEHQIHALMTKMKFLGIPGDNYLANALNTKPNLSPDAVQKCIKELLHIMSEEKVTPNIEILYPLLNALYINPLYHCADKKTVMWGNHGGIFYINQYGSDVAPIWRKESEPIPGYRDDKYANRLPPHQEVTNGDNRIGNILIDGSRTKRKYKDPAHIMDILGVAFAEDPKKDLYAYLTERTINSTKRDSVYVLILWDRNLTRVDPELRWEPASELRLRLGRRKADERILVTAKKNQTRFEEYTGIQRNSSMDPQHPQSSFLVSVQQSRSTSPVRTRRRGRSASVANTGHSLQQDESISQYEAEPNTAETQEMRKMLINIQRWLGMLQT